MDKKSYVAGYVANFSKGTLSSRQQFDHDVLKLLDVYLARQGKRLDRLANSVDTGIDAVAPEGIDNLSGPTGVVLTTMDSADPLISAVSLAAFNGEFSSILAIYGSKISLNLRTEIENYLDTKKNSVGVEIWTSGDLETRFADLAESLAVSIPQLAPVAIETLSEDRSATGQEKSTWRSERERYLDGLRKAVSKSDMALFLGAGVSSSAGMPTWPKLLGQLQIAMVNHRFSGGSELRPEEVGFVNRSFASLYAGSPLLAAHYLKQALEDKFELETARALYRSIEGRSGSSDLIQAISRICAFRAALKTDIVTYNFDDLVERELREKGLQSCVTTYGRRAA